MACNDVDCAQQLAAQRRRGGECADFRASPSDRPLVAPPAGGLAPRPAPGEYLAYNMSESMHPVECIKTCLEYVNPYTRGDARLPPTADRGLGRVPESDGGVTGYRDNLNPVGRPQHLAALRTAVLAALGESEYGDMIDAEAIVVSNEADVGELSSDNARSLGPCPLGAILSSRHALFAAPVRIDVAQALGAVAAAYPCYAMTRTRAIGRLPLLPGPGLNIHATLDPAVSVAPATLGYVFVRMPTWRKFADDATLPRGPSVATGYGDTAAPVTVPLPKGTAPRPLAVAPDPAARIGPVDRALLSRSDGVFVPYTICTGPQLDAVYRAWQLEDMKPGPGTQLATLHLSMLVRYLYRPRYTANGLQAVIMERDAVFEQVAELPNDSLLKDMCDANPALVSQAFCNCSAPGYRAVVGSGVESARRLVGSVYLGSSTRAVPGCDTVCTGSFESASGRPQLKLVEPREGLDQCPPINICNIQVNVANTSAGQGLYVNPSCGGAQGQIHSYMQQRQSGGRTAVRMQPPVMTGAAIATLVLGCVLIAYWVRGHKNSPAGRP